MDLLTLIVVILVVAWLCGVGFSVGGSLIHLLLIVAVVIVFIRVLQGRNPIP